MGQTDQPSQLLTEWWYHRLQAVGRSANRYLLLLLTVSAYTLGVHLTRDSAESFVHVQFLGLRLPKPFVEAFAVSVLAIAALAFLGATQAFESAYESLATQLRMKPEDLPQSAVDQNPSLLDFLGYATIVRGEPFRALTNIVWLFVYPLPLAAALVWAVVLWWNGAEARPYLSPWLVGVHIVNAVFLIWAWVRAFRFVKGRWMVVRKHVRQRANS